MSLLDLINKPEDVKKIPEEKLRELAKEIRRYLMKVVSENGGHLASNLGAVELTLALHRKLDLPKDKIIWDVGHQSYVHKILTGRKEELKSLRKKDGIAGFPKRKESDCDAFDTGHASTSISAALGYAVARDLRGGKEKVVAVIGDGAMTGGMALEALNNAGSLKSNLIIILNDNEMSISENVGGVAKYLGNIRTSNHYLNLKQEVKEVLNGIPAIGNKLFHKLQVSKDSLKRLFVPGMFFEDMGITYLGPVDGHNLKDLRNALNNAERVKGAVLIHVITKKGKGYRLAEENPGKFHGVEPFFVKTGEMKKAHAGKSYTQIFSESMLELAEEDERIVGITAAMPSGTGLSEFKKRYPNRFFDVGIAEEHAVTFSAGLAAAGMKPVVAIYSTFLQRAYDQILHDVCIGNLPVVFAIDRAGLVGSDGETHQGIFDVGYLSTIPNLTIMAPRDGEEFRQMLRFAIQLNKPVAVRYPRGIATETLFVPREELRLDKNEVIKRGQNIAIFASGKMVEMGLKISEALKEKNLLSTLVNIRFLDKIDLDFIRELRRDHETILTLEENVFSGSYSERLMAVSAKEELGFHFIPMTLPNEFVEHGSVPELSEQYGFNIEKIVERVQKEAIRKLDRELFRESME